VLRFSLNGTVEVLSTLIMAWFVSESTYASLEEEATSDVTKLMEREFEGKKIQNPDEDEKEKENKDLHDISVGQVVDYE
jgi:hypothetical protein